MDLSVNWTDMILQGEKCQSHGMWPHHGPVGEKGEVRRMEECQEGLDEQRSRDENKLCVLGKQPSVSGMWSKG